MSRMSASMGTGFGTGMKSIRKSPRSTRPPARSRCGPYSQYGYRKDQRYFAVNLFCEVDRPGEWYLDRRSGMVYWIPPGHFDPSRTPTTLSVLAEPFVVMENVKHVILLGLTFQEGRGDGIHIRAGAECLVAGCTLRQLGGDGIVVEEAAAWHLRLHDAHARLRGAGRVAGERARRSRPVVTSSRSCSVSDISRLKRTYTPAVLLDGCGNRVAHNSFEAHAFVGSADRGETISLSRLDAIRHVVQELDDQGGLDMFGNPLYRGVVICWNHWIDIRGGTRQGAAGVRLDDMISGVAIYGNVFERCGAVQFGGVHINGGKDNLVDGNLFLDCCAGVSFSRGGEKRWLEAIHGFLPAASAAPYSTRYPDLARIKADADVNFVSRNVFVRCRESFLGDGGVERMALNAMIDWPVIPAFLSTKRPSAAIRNSDGFYSSRSRSVRSERILIRGRPIRSHRLPRNDDSRGQPPESGIETDTWTCPYSLLYWRRLGTLTTCG